jgi:hypothetical protein
MQTWMAEVRVQKQYIDLLSWRLPALAAESVHMSTVVPMASQELLRQAK